MSAEIVELVEIDDRADQMIFASPGWPFGPPHCSAIPGQRSRGNGGGSALCAADF